jgi:sensor histidine kinase YesM
MKVTISTYWKCQLIGWGSYSLYLYLANLIIIYGNSVLRRAIITGLFGMVATHVLRWIIKRLKIFDKTYTNQVIYLVLLNVIIQFFAAILLQWVLRVAAILAKDLQPAFSVFSLSRFIRNAVSQYYEGLILASAWTAVYFFVQYTRKIKKAENEKADLKIKLLESEAHALRAQMNPHFIFNCLNSIKALINKNENDKAVNYLTVFSRLILSLFHNSDKREVGLYEELETCKLYTQLEKMRFGDKVDFVFDIDGSINLKSFKVPALIIQPFIENAIWHGLVPKESGGNILVSAKENKGIIHCTIDDDGIGRKLSQQYKVQYESTYQSKGIGLTRSRLELDKILNDRDNMIDITDKTDINGKPAGTRITLTFNHERQ